MVSKYLIKYYIRGWVGASRQGEERSQGAWKMQKLKKWLWELEFTNTSQTESLMERRTQTRIRAASVWYRLGVITQPLQPVNGRYQTSTPKHYNQSSFCIMKLKLNFDSSKKKLHIFFSTKNYVLCSLKALIIK